MKEKQSKQHAGIWMDGHHAWIIANAPENETEHFVVEEKVGSPESTKGGSEHTNNNAKHADTLSYFKDLSQRLLRYDEIFLFGPGKAQEQFQNFLETDAHFLRKKITLGTASKLSAEEMISQVKGFFAPHTF